MIKSCWRYVNEEMGKTPTMKLPLPPTLWQCLTMAVPA